MEKNNKKMIIGSITVLTLVLLFAGTFALWTITKKQTDVNSLNTACLEFEISSEGTGLSLNKQWPVSLKEGYKKEGYTFTVTNKCDEPLNYIIALEELKEDGFPNEDSYVNKDYVDITIDNRTPKAYSLYDDITDDNDDQIMDTRMLKTAWVKPNATNTHTIKMWLDENTDVNENGKIFNSKVRVTGGQKLPYNKNITSESCFTINEEGQITNFDYENCGSDVVFPPTVNGIQVKSIKMPALTNHNITSIDLNEAYYLEEIGNTGLNGFVGEGTELIIPGNIILNARAFVTFNGSNLMIEDGITELPLSCFGAYVGENTTLHIPSSVTAISTGALAKFNGKEILFEEGIQDIYISQYTQDYAGTGTNLEFPSTTRTIEGFFGFQGDSIKFNEGLETIGEGGASFNIYNGKSPLVIPSTVTLIKGFPLYSGTVIIKNTEGSVQLGTNTFQYADVIYNPNYKE